MNEERKMSEAGKGSDGRISTKETRENFRSGYDSIKWTTKDDRQEKFTEQENDDDDDESNTKRNR